MNKRATIEDVARIAGVSTATVSRTIHTPDVVSDSTREAVFGAIDQTGYTLNMAARSLRRNRANAVIVLVPDIGNTFFSEILAGIERVASAAGQTILIGHTGKDPAREAKFLESLANGQADGALLLNGHLPDQVGKRLQSRSAPIVSVSETLDPQVVPHVGIDNVKAAMAATQHLLDQGHKRIAHVTGPEDNILTHQRISGFRAAMEAADLASDLLLPGDFTIDSGIAAVAGLLAMQPTPTAVFCANDEMAIGLMSELALSRVVVPRDVSVIGFDDIAFAKSASPALTTIRQPRAEFGERAMQLILEMIDGTEDSGQTTVLLESHLVIRKSVAPPAGKS